MNALRFAEFSDAYRASLAEAVSYQPNLYAYDAAEVPAVASKMLSAIEKNPHGVNYTNSPGFKITCSKLGIKYTVKAIMQYLEV